MSDAIAIGWRQFRLERKQFWRNPTAAFFGFLLPVVFLLIIGSLTPASDRDIIIPGIAGMNVMASTFNAKMIRRESCRNEGAKFAFPLRITMRAFCPSLPATTMSRAVEDWCGATTREATGARRHPPRPGCDARMPAHRREKGSRRQRR